MNFKSRFQLLINMQLLLEKIHAFTGWQKEFWIEVWSFWRRQWTASPLTRRIKKPLTAPQSMPFSYIRFTSTSGEIRCIWTKVSFEKSKYCFPCNNVIVVTFLYEMDVKYHSVFQNICWVLLIVVLVRDNVRKQSKAEAHLQSQTAPGASRECSRLLVHGQKWVSQCNWSGFADGGSVCRLW